VSTGVCFFSCSVNVQLCRSCNMFVHIIVSTVLLYNSGRKTTATNFSCNTARSCCITARGIFLHNLFYPLVSDRGPLPGQLSEAVQHYLPHHRRRHVPGRQPGTLIILLILLLEHPLTYLLIQYHIPGRQPGTYLPTTTHPLIPLPYGSLTAF
jgi:hypothetical protein